MEETDGRMPKKEPVAEIFESVNTSETEQKRSGLATGQAFHRGLATTREGPQSARQKLPKVVVLHQTRVVLANRWDQEVELRMVKLRERGDAPGAS